MARLLNRWMACRLLAGFMMMGIMFTGLMGCDQQEPTSTVAVAASLDAAQAPPPAQPTAPPLRPAPGSAGRQVTAPPLGLPPIEFHPAKVDLGTILPGIKTPFTATIQNIGKRTVKIVQARPSCVCTTISLTKMSIEPGENIPLEIEYSSTTGLGHKKAAVRILFEGYDIVELQIEAFVALGVHAEPSYINALEDENGKPILAGEYTVQSSDGQPFRILAVNAWPPPYVDFDPTKDQPRNSYKLKWDLKDYAVDTCRNALGFRMPGWLAIETDHPNCAIFDIEIRHRCVRRTFVGNETWTPQEKRVLVGAIKPGESAEIEVTAKYLPKRSHDDVIKSVVTESSEFTAELIDVKGSMESMVCRIRITPTQDHKGLVYGTMRISSDRQSDPVTVIAVVR